VGDIVVTIEAMKMENQIRATMEGTVSKILVNEGDVVAEGAPLVALGG
jgi:biotin carboxyl carrier protein